MLIVTWNKLVGQLLCSDDFSVKTHPALRCDILNCLYCLLLVVNLSEVPPQGQRNEALCCLRMR